MKHFTYLAIIILVVVPCAPSCNNVLGGGEASNGGDQTGHAPVFRDTEMVVLNESAGATDPRAKYRLPAAFREILNGRSALLISHRMSTVRMADHTYVMHERSYRLERVG